MEHFNARQWFHLGLVIFCASFLVINDKLPSSRKSLTNSIVSNPSPQAISSTSEKFDFNKLIQSANKKLHNVGIKWCHKYLKFRKGEAESLDKIGLISYPGSGNTWLRYLLQQATGYYTGSEYNDLNLQFGGFPAEGVNNQSVIVVKTHYQVNISDGHFDRIILLVRNPFDTAQSAFNFYNGGGHKGYAFKTRFESQDWPDFVQQMAGNWADFYIQWFQSYEAKDRLVIDYNELKAKPVYTTLKILSFLNENISKNTLKCLEKNVHGTFQRFKAPFEVQFSNEMKEILLKNEQRLVKVIYKN